MAKKIDYVYEVVRMMQALVSESDIAYDRWKEFFDNGYNSGGADELTNAELSNAGIELTAAQFTSVINFLQQFDNLITNQTVTESDYSATLNSVRRIETP